ncbi:MAG: hypothetical protein EKK68_10345 [Candidatus Competibacteraceae bacterium]|nr:MAG: hypothetical protein EKK68_10345 [Candidatus Competibacteraceae bacterium]
MGRDRRFRGWFWFRGWGRFWSRFRFWGRFWLRGRFRFGRRDRGRRHGPGRAAEPPAPRDCGGDQHHQRQQTHQPSDLSSARFTTRVVSIHWWCSHTGFRARWRGWNRFRFLHCGRHCVPERRWNPALSKLSDWRCHNRKA